MSDEEQLVTIGVLARASGLTASALRFYDDCGLLTPAEVDAVTGYRYYRSAQLERAMLIRRLREIEVGLDGITAILSGDRALAEHLLDEHVDALERRARHAADTARAIKAELNSGPRVLLPGPALAHAIEQVGSAVAADDGIRVLTGFLLEVERDALILTATDRYRLTTRTLVPLRRSGGDWSLVVAGTELTAIEPWLRTTDEVALSPGDRGLLLNSGGIERHCRSIAEPYPDYRAVLSGLAPVRTRVVLTRDRLLDAIDAAGPALVFSAHPAPQPGTTGANPANLAPADQATLVVAAPGTAGEELPAAVIGTAVELAFATPTLRPALQSAVGPDIMLDISAPDQPVVIRSASVGDLTTVTMPTVRPTPDTEENT
ncbi:hypothetical protein B0T36_03955 [Nocardia donostiensis]|uniref:DNA polymerase III subunit beta family protein n=1 Tax=Nocardia donostiensis TaxID=1538463 RepID=UPI0009DA65F2|nr:MerR family transcriptional regulator [Nocardia donostiensis]OQS16812.1 hypothetical protein B0T36_03955 [Nocardia donostiensis]